MPTGDPTARFAELLAGPRESLPLDEAVLLVAAHDHEVDVPAQRARLDHLAARCEAPTLEGVLAHLFGAEGFDGDVTDYHHPDNSFLDRVLDRRRGLPILLSILTAEVACRVGVCLATVGMPGHFLLRDCADAEVFVDPFRSGQRIDRAECERLFRTLHPDTAFHESFLEPIDSHAVLSRVVANLARTFLERGPASSAAWALELRTLLADGDAAWRDLARIRERLGDWGGAAEAWTRLAPTAADPAAVERRIAALRGRMN